MNDDDERQARLAAIRERLNTATPGPWEFDSYCRVLAPPAHLDDAEHYGNIVAWVPAWHGDTACKPHDGNAELIANAPSDLAWLLAEVEWLEVERDESVANMTAASAAFARLQRNAEAWNEDSKRLHNEYLPTSRIMDEVLATRDAALMKAWAERDAFGGQVAALREALAGMLESYEFCLGDELALSDLTKDVMRGAFVGEPERARAALAAAGEEGQG